MASRICVLSFRVSEYMNVCMCEREREREIEKEGETEKEENVEM